MHDKDCEFSEPLIIVKSRKKVYIGYLSIWEGSQLLH